MNKNPFIILITIYKMKKISLFFYITGSLLLTLPIIIYKLFQSKSTIINNLINIFNFRLDIITILLILSSIILIIFYDILFFNNKNQLSKNLILIEQIFGKKFDIKLILVLSLLSGYFEELLFRGYLYFSLNRILEVINIFNAFYSDLIIILFISILFALLHIIQGKEIFIISLLISIIFFISIKASNSIWYAVLTHSIINFIEFSFIIPYQKKKLL
jgi:membrane protease YdiL (CAAX protease family)